MPDTVPSVPKDRSLESLIEDCALESSRTDSPAAEPSACYEIFRRACSQPRDEQAWEALYAQYKRLIYKWLRQYADEDTFQDTFLRFFQAQDATRPFEERYADLPSVLAYLKCCAASVRIATWRAEKRRNAVVKQLSTDLTLSSTNLFSPQLDASLRELVMSHLKDDKGYLVFTLTYVEGLTPRDIQARFPELFPDVKVIYRIRENFAKRLRRDAAIAAWLDE